MEQFLENIFQNMPFLAAFIAGILTFISPCVLPLIPVYMTYISGQSLQNIKSMKGDFVLFLQACSFVFGFGIIFIFLGASMAKIIEVFASPLLKQLAGIIVILFGIHFLGIFRFSFLYQTKKYEIQQQKEFSRFLSPFVLGISFSLGWTPCIGPIFTSIVLLGGSQESLGLSLMFVYTLGLGIPFLLVAIVIQKSFRVLKWLKNYFRVIEVLSGLLLIALGVGILSGYLDKIGGV